MVSDRVRKGYKRQQKRDQGFVVYVVFIYEYIHMFKCLCRVLPCDWLTSVRNGYVSEAYVNTVLMTTQYLILVTFVGESRCQEVVTDLGGY